MCVTIMKDTNFAFQSRVAVFALPCLQLQRLCIIAEEKPDSYDEEIYVWMNKVRDPRTRAGWPYDRVVRCGART